MHEKFCSSIREHATNILNFEKKNISLLTKEELKLLTVQEIVTFVKKELYKSLLKIKITKKLEVIAMTQIKTEEQHIICSLKFDVPNEMTAICHTGSNCDYHFIIKALTNKFEGKLKCLVENTGKYNMLFVLIKKEITKIYKDGNQNIVTISYKKNY